LFDVPLFGNMAIEHMPLADGRLFIYKPVVLLGKPSKSEIGTGKPTVKACNKNIE
jgi:hypothetical protein